jgi:hypothetical protein
MEEAEVNGKQRIYWTPGIIEIVTEPKGFLLTG